MTFGLCDGFKNFDKLLSVSDEAFVLHGQDWIHGVARSYTTTAYGWLFPSLRTLWSAVIKSPNSSARGRASPVRLLQGALVILVRKQTSQFRSLVKWIQTLCFLDFDTTFVGRSDSESSEMCAAAGTFCVIKIICNLLQPFRKISQTVVWISIAIPFFFLSRRGDTLQFPEAGPSLRSRAGHVGDKSCDVDVVFCKGLL